MRSWYLEDVVTAAQASPESFFIPSAKKRHECQVGDLVRLHFILRDPGEDEPRAERMWVQVNERIEDGAICRYCGVLDNQPVYIHDLELGDTIEFQANHIARTLLTPDDPSYLTIGEQSAVVSALVLESGRQACWAYREGSERPEDSGWRLYRGDEDEAFMEDAGNIRICNIYWLADRDPTLLQIFRADVGCAFERAEEKGDWETVTDWSPEDS